MPVPDLIIRLLEANPVEYVYGIDSLADIVCGLIEKGKYDTALVSGEKTALIQASQHVSSFATMSSPKKDEIISNMKRIMYSLIGDTDEGANESYVSPSGVSVLRYLVLDCVEVLVHCILKMDETLKLITETDKIFFTRMLQNDSFKCVGHVFNYGGYQQRLLKDFDLRQIRSDDMALVFATHEYIYSRMIGHLEHGLKQWLCFLIEKDYKKALNKSISYITPCACYEIGKDIESYKSTEYMNTFMKTVFEIYPPPPPLLTSLPTSPKKGPPPSEGTGLIRATEGAVDEIPPLTLDESVKLRTSAHVEPPVAPAPAPELPVSTDAMVAFELQVNKEVERRFDEYVAKKKQEFAEAVKKQFAERLRNLGCGQEEINRCVAKVFIA
jgi:hypothetical protein